MEVLNAQVDLNSDSSLILNQKQNIKQAKIELNTLMVRDLQTDFKVSEDILLDVNLDLITLKQNLESQNPQLKAQILEKKITELQYKQVKANRYPVFKVNTGYNFNQSSASLGFVTQSSGRGFNYGFSASIPIFNGFSQKRNEKIAIIQIENANYLIENQKLTLENQLTTIYENYKMLLNLIHLEEKNIEIAKQNLELTLAKFKIGTITTFELRMAQQNYIDAKVRYYQVIYQTKLNEINLKEISGTLSFI